VLVSFTAIRGSTSLSVLCVGAIGPAGGTSGPPPADAHAASSTPPTAVQTIRDVNFTT
jgi:hypothetical protein